VTRAASVLVYRARRALRRHGVGGVAREGLHRLAAIPAQRRQRHRDRDFDRANAVDTAGIVHLGGLEIVSDNRELGTRYQPTNPDVFRTLVEALPIDHREFAFVDYGSGKGRALMLAAEFPFRRIVGVEFSPELTEIARRNLESFGRERRSSTEFELVCVDAVEYDIPDEPAVLYFYNPFAEQVLRRVLERIRASLQARERPAFIVTTGDTSRDAIEEAGFAALDRAGVYVWSPAREGSRPHQASSSQPSS
jgi:SAM-dependent methyltransferase